MKLEVAGLSSPSVTVTVRTVSVDVKATLNSRAQGLCESRGGRPWLPVPNNPYGLCGRKATLNERYCPRAQGAVLKWRWPSPHSS